jgi:hypothetical protein
VSGDLAVWCGAFMTLCILSFLYRDNPFFRLAESVFAGVSLGYYIGISLGQTLRPNLIEPLFLRGENFALIVPMLLGILLYARYVPKIDWIARYALAVYVGYFTGVTMMQKLQGEVQPQSADTILSVVRGVPNTGELINNLVIVVGVLSVLVYFFFSAEHKGAVGGVGRIGIWFLMVSFGAAFGYTIMGRVSILIGRFNFLLTEWLGVGG